MSRYLHSLPYSWVTFFFGCHVMLYGDFLGGSDGKELACNSGDSCSLPGLWKTFPSPGREGHPTLVFLPGEFQGQRSLVGYSPWGHEESDTTEPSNTTHAFLYLQFRSCYPKTKQKGFTFTAWSYRKGNMEALQNNWQQGVFLWKVQSLLSGKSQEYNSSSDIAKVRTAGDGGFRKNW